MLRLKIKVPSTPRDFKAPQEWSALVGNCRFLSCIRVSRGTGRRELSVEADVKSVLLRERRGHHGVCFLMQRSAVGIGLPTAEPPFAQDAVFAYKSPSLNISFNQILPICQKKKKINLLLTFVLQLLH